LEYVRLDVAKEAVNKQRIIHFSMVREMKIIDGVRNFFVHQRIMSTAELVSDWILCIVLRGCWYDNVILDVHASSENESDDSRDGFCEELEEVFIHSSTL
jgi:hypothetical protein